MYVRDTDLLLGLLTMAAEMFWSMKMRTDRAKPRPAPAMMVPGASSDSGAGVNGFLSSYLNCSTGRTRKRLSVPFFYGSLSGFEQTHV